jgi:hypothetical protein
MMMDFQKWRESVSEIASQIADAEFQRRAWFGKGHDEVSSPDEMYNQLFNDAQFEQFLAMYKHKLTGEQLVAGETLVRTMKDFANQTAAHLDPFAVIDDPAWQKIRNAARAFVTSITWRDSGA